VVPVSVVPVSVVPVPVSVVPVVPVSVVMVSVTVMTFSLIWCSFRGTIVGRIWERRGSEVREYLLRIRYAGDLVIDDPAAALLESTTSLIVGAVGAGNVPRALRSWGATLSDDRANLRLLLTAGDRSLEDLAPGHRVAVTATDFRTLRSVQVKGRTVALEGATAHDRIRFDRYAGEVVPTLAEIDDMPEEVVVRFLPADVVACTIVIEAVFDQTPGPDAGCQLAPVVQG
jgi:hypothetical protein